MTPIDFKILQATWEMCDFQVRCSSRTTPRKTVSLTCSILCSFTLIYIGKWYFFCLGLNNIKFVFFRFKESLLALNQADNLLSSELSEAAR